jgi:hypothetical protein
MDAPAEVTDYLDRLVERLREVLGVRLVGAYALGSLALGGYRPGRSDIDVLAVVHGTLPVPDLERLARRCVHASLPCPASKLELVVIGAAEARAPGARPRWQLNLNSGADMNDHVGLDPSAEPSHWFVLDLAIAPRHGVTLAGPPASEVVGEPELEHVRDAQSDAVAWYAHHEPGAGAVAAACRAWHWNETGRFVGKTEALRWALGRLGSPA